MVDLNRDARPAWVREIPHEQRAAQERDDRNCAKARIEDEDSSPDVNVVEHGHSARAPAWDAACEAL